MIKTSNVQRMKENLAVFDFELMEQEMQEIAELDKGHTCFMPRNTGRAVTDFLTTATTGRVPSGVIQK